MKPPALSISLQCAAVKRNPKTDPHAFEVLTASGVYEEAPLLQLRIDFF